MTSVESQLASAVYTQDWSGCDPERCALAVDSDDEAGATAQAFNSLIRTLAKSHSVETAMHDFSGVLSREFEREGLGSAALDGLLRHTASDAGVMLVVRIDRECASLRIAAAPVLRVHGGGQLRLDARHRRGEGPEAAPDHEPRQGEVHRPHGQARGQGRRVEHRRQHGFGRQTEEETERRKDEADGETEPDHPDRQVGEDTVGESRHGSGSGQDRTLRRPRCAKGRDGG
jgi:hypothetical protein